MTIEEVIKALIDIADEASRKTDSPWRDAAGYDMENYNTQGFNGEGYDRQGYDATGFDGSGRDRQGYGRDGLHTDGGRDRCGFDTDGYNSAGRDRLGYDRHGYDHLGLDHVGFDKWGLNLKGIDIKGFDKEGYDSEGLDRAGFDRRGLNASGETRISTEMMELDAAVDASTHIVLTREKLMQVGGHADPEVDITTKWGGAKDEDDATAKGDDYDLEGPYGETLAGRREKMVKENDTLSSGLRKMFGPLVSTGGDTEKATDPELLSAELEPSLEERVSALEALVRGVCP